MGRNQEARELLQWLQERDSIESVDFTRDGFQTVIVETSFTASDGELIALCNKAHDSGYYPDEADRPGYVVMTRKDNAGAD